MTKPKLGEKTRLDLHSGDYVKVLEAIPMRRLVRLLPLMSFEKTDALVDLACGPGTLSHLVHAQLARYEGVDFSPDFVSSARDWAARLGIGNAFFQCEDVVSYCSSRPETADVVTSFDFSEHIYDEDFLRIFRAAYGLLRPGGRLYLYTPNLDFFYERMKDNGMAPQFPQHIAVRDEAWQRRLLQECGFAPEAIHCAFPSHYNVFRYLHSLSRLPWIGRHFRAKLFFTCVK